MRPGNTRKGLIAHKHLDLMGFKSIRENKRLSCHVDYKLP